MTAFLDTNVLIRHLTGDPREEAARATALLKSGELLLLADLVVAETIYVLESFYKIDRARIGQIMRAVLTFRSIRTVEPEILLRSLEIYESHRLDYAESYLCALAESTGVGRVASFDRSIDRLTTVKRLAP